MSNADNREIELKFEVLDTTLLDAFEVITETIPRQLVAETLRAETDDAYWGTKDNFVRARHSTGTCITDGTPRSLTEVTVKRKDRGNTLNRYEKNHSVDDITSAMTALAAALGEPVGILKKDDELVIFLEGLTVISLSLVRDRLFLEVEAPLEKTVRHYVKMLKATRLKLRTERRSLSELFIFT